MLHHEDTIPEVAEISQGLKEPLVISLVQADARFVEHIQDAHQAGADLGRQPEPLGFAARKGVAGSLQREVGEADLGEELQPLSDLAEEAVGDRLVLGREAKAVKPGPKPAQVELRCLVNVDVPDGHGEGVAREARSLAGRTRLDGEVCGELIQLSPLQLSTSLALQGGYHSFKRQVEAVILLTFPVIDGFSGTAASVEEKLAGLRRQILKRSGKTEAVTRAQPFQACKKGMRTAAGPWSDGALVQGAPGIGYYEVRIERLDCSET